MRTLESEQMVASPFLSTKEAAVYLKYRSASGIRNAVARGWLVPSGVGPRGMLLFTREELHRFAAARAARYAARRNGMPGESEVPDETIGRCDEVSRRASSWREAVPGAAAAVRLAALASKRPAPTAAEEVDLDEWTISASTRWTGPRVVTSTKSSSSGTVPDRSS